MVDFVTKKQAFLVIPRKKTFSFVELTCSFLLERNKGNSNYVMVTVVYPSHIDFNLRASWHNRRGEVGT